MTGSAGTDQWECQSQWVRRDKAGIRVLRKLRAPADMAEKKPRVHMWIFAHKGLTGSAKKFAEENGILRSTRQEFDEHLDHRGPETFTGFASKNLASSLILNIMGDGDA